MAGNMGFVLIVAGLPRTGTTSTAVALQQILKGDIYDNPIKHPDYYTFWSKVSEHKESVEDWQTTLGECRGGVVPFFYREVMAAFPNAKVLLIVRDPVKWYQSVKDSVFKIHITMVSWPCSWFTTLIGARPFIELSSKVGGYYIQPYSTTGLCMFDVVAAGEEMAVQFNKDYVNEVKTYVPADRLLVWEVKEGWAPLCKFLDLPVPDSPFPRVNDSEMFDRTRKIFLILSWFFIVILPAAMVLGAYYFNLFTLDPFLRMVGGYVLVIGLLRFVALPQFRKYSD